MGLGIEYLEQHLHLQMLSQFFDASRDFVVILRRLIRQTVCSVVEPFPEEAIDGVEYQKLFIATASGYIMAFG